MGSGTLITVPSLAKSYLSTDSLVIQNLSGSGLVSVRLSSMQVLVTDTLILSLVALKMSGIEKHTTLILLSAASKASVGLSKCPLILESSTELSVYSAEIFVYTIKRNIG